MTRKPEAVLYDWHGTLVDVSSIVHLVEGDKKDHEAFYEKSLMCPPNQAILDQCLADLCLGLRVLIGTGMPSTYGGGLREWLRRYGVWYSVLTMRPPGDKRDDVEFKRDAVARMGHFFNIQHAYDDKRKIAKMLEEEFSIPTTIVKEEKQ